MNDTPLPTTLAAALAALRDRLPVAATDAAAPPPTPTCPHCAGRGFLVAAVPVGHPDFGRLHRCACNPPRLAPALATAIAAALAEPERTLATFRQDRPLARSLRWQGETYTPPQQAATLAAALTAVAGFIRRDGPPFLYLSGPVGSGKSHLAQAAYHTLATEVPTAYLTAAGLLAYLRAGVAEQTNDARLAAVQQVPILILDDLGTEPVTAWGLGRLFDVLDTRSAQQRRTLITSNLAWDDLTPTGADRMTALAWERLASRIAGAAGAPVALVASDYRCCGGEAER